MNKLHVVTSVVTYLLAASASADVVWDESIHGDLSSDNFNPTVLSVGAGSNIVLGDTSPDPSLDPDFFIIAVPAGHELSSIVFVEYATTDDQSFFAVEVGSQISSTGDPSGLLSGTLIGGLPGTQQGDQLLDDLQNPIIFGGFTGFLGEGIYTFWFQETDAPTDYGFDFLITPVPAPASAVLLSGGLLMMRRRRR